MRILATLALLVCYQLSVAQWSTDPNNPMIICNAAEQQRLPQVLDDGNNGWFVFWKDKRADGNFNEIYGQHLDNNGNALWTENGKLIISDPARSVIVFEVKKLASGELLFFYGTNAGTISQLLLAMKVDSNGDPLWTNPTLIAQPEENLLAFHDPLIQPTATGAILAFRPQISGGQYQTRFNRIENDGTILYGVNGHHLVTTAHGPIDIMSDGDDGAIVHWRNNNGGGTHMGVMRLSNSSQELWLDIVDPVESSSGLYHDYRAISDNAGGIIISFVETGAQIKALHIDGNGNHLWTPNIKPVGTFSSIQDKPRLTLHDNAIYICWEDNRPPAANQDLYIQKMDMNGDTQWSPEGMLAVQGNTYIPWNAITEDNNSGVIVTQLMSGDGFLAQKINEDGNAEWSEETQITVQTLVPFYGEYELVSDPAGGAICVWYNTDDQDLYAARVGPNGALGEATGIDELISNDKPIIYPNPSNDFINIEGNLPVRSIELHNMAGEIILSKRNVNQLDISSLSSGIYMVTMTLQNDILRTEKLVVK